MKVSVVVPVYKAERYLEACVESILQQDYPEMEVILVDDGSPDNCPGLCDDYADKFNCVKVIHQKNMGAGASRNVGIEAATGKYICFVDADDCLDEKKALSVMMRCAEAENADIVVGNFRKLTERGVSDINYHHLETGAYEKTVDFRFKGFFQYGHLGFNWGKCYKKEFLERFRIRCTTIPFTEDKSMNLCCCVSEPRYGFVPESVYLYRVNEESATYRYRPDLAELWTGTAKHMEQFMKRNEVSGDYNDLMDFHIFLGIITVIQQEFRAGNNKILHVSRKLKDYGRESFVKKCIGELARGKYVFRIGSAIWKILIWGTSVVFTVHGYWLIVFGFWLLNVTKLERLIIDSKYKKEEK